jgi:hypothetical protein
VSRALAASDGERSSLVGSSRAPTHLLVAYGDEHLSSLEVEVDELA